MTLHPLRSDRQAHRHFPKIRNALDRPPDPDERWAPLSASSSSYGWFGGVRANRAVNPWLPRLRCGNDQTTLAAETPVIEASGKWYRSKHRQSLLQDGRAIRKLPQRFDPAKYGWGCRETDSSAQQKPAILCADSFFPEHQSPNHRARRPGYTTCGKCNDRAA